MTVASLWKALDRAGCGRAVGSSELRGHKHLDDKTTPWNCNEVERSKPDNRPTLAVDLSIWICESLCSQAIATNHAEPALHLVYTRTLKLLNLGIKLIMVIEGKRRIRRTNGYDDDFQKRRSGTNFWRACQRCEEMLRLIGVPVVRARAEGEALCALLNQRGIVDGVISNDGDCLLFGAKVLYTKFSIENLEQSRVIRYDLCELRACVDDDDSDEYDQTSNDNKQQPDIAKLSRDDLMVFAILTGSDLAGNGLAKVGCRKAIRFIRKCQIDNPLKRVTAAMDELKSWAKAALVDGAGSNFINDSNQTKQHCSCCCHPGTKTSHKKNGCKLCGTDPGEACFAVSPGGRFRKSLRAKALEMKPRFDPTSVAKVYQQPNENQIPVDLIGVTARTLEMGTPRLDDIIHSSLIVRGRSAAESRHFLRQSLSSYLARATLFLQMSTKKHATKGPKRLPVNKNRPVPRQIQKSMTRNGTACFEVQWIVKATTTDTEGNPIDEFEFTTIEEQHMMKKCHPSLNNAFEEEKRQGRKQGSAEQERRRAFLDSMCHIHVKKQDLLVEKREKQLMKKNGRYRTRRKTFVFKSDSAENISCSSRLSPRRQKRWGEDANQLLRFVGTQKGDGLGLGSSSIDNSSLSSRGSVGDYSLHKDVRFGESWGTRVSDYCAQLTPGHIHFLGFKQGDPILESCGGFRRSDSNTKKELASHSLANYLDHEFVEKNQHIVNEHVDTESTSPRIEQRFYLPENVRQSLSLDHRENNDSTKLFDQHQHSSCEKAFCSPDLKRHRNMAHLPFTSGAESLQPFPSSKPSHWMAAPEPYCFQSERFAKAGESNCRSVNGIGFPRLFSIEAREPVDGETNYNLSSVCFTYREGVELVECPTSFLPANHRGDCSIGSDKKDCMDKHFENISNRSEYEGIVQTVEQKLKSKQREALLDFDCSKQLLESSNLNFFDHSATWNQNVDAFFV